jgi:ribonuclease HI
MEMLAVIEALACLKGPRSVEVFTDSKYLHDAVNKGWLSKWRRNGWQTAQKKPVKNQDLWVRLDALLSTHKVRLRWVRGHSGDAENECCDRLAGAAALREDLPEDASYVRSGEKTLRAKLAT